MNMRRGRHVGYTASDERVHPTCSRNIIVSTVIYAIDMGMTGQWRGRERSGGLCEQGSIEGDWRFG